VPSSCSITFVGVPVERQPLGTLLLVDALVKDAAGVAQDATMTFDYLVGKLGDTVTAVTPTKIATGQYRVELALGEAGVWYLRWKAAGTYVGYAESQLVVKRSNFPS